MEKSRAYKATITVVCLPLLLAVAAFCWHLKEQSSLNQNILAEGEARDPALAFEKALDAYQKNRIEETAELLSIQPFSFVSIDDGCSLLVSVFAEKKEWSVLEKVSSLCIESGKDLDISYEGLAYSLAADGRIKEAIEKLDGDLKKHDSPRMRVSLSRLYLMSGKDELAARHYLQAVKLADVWSMWVTYVLKVKPLAENPHFIQSLVDVVAQKADKVPSVEQKLRKHAELLSSGRSEGTETDAGGNESVKNRNQSQTPVNSGLLKTKTG